MKNPSGATWQDSAPPHSPARVFGNPSYRESEGKPEPLPLRHQKKKGGRETAKGGTEQEPEPETSPAHASRGERIEPGCFGEVGA